MKESDDDMIPVFGANVSQFGDDVSIHSDDPGHARRSLLENKGFENDWFKVYFQ